MGKFLRDNIVGIVLVSAAGSVLAGWLAPYLPSPVGQGAWWRTLFVQPVPVFVLFPYSVALVWSFAMLMRHWQFQEHARSAQDKARLDEQVRILSAERDALRQRVSEPASLSLERLMRFVAVVLSDVADPAPKTHQNVCRSVAGLVGPGFQHSSIAEALGAMLHIGAVRSSAQAFVLAPDWQAKVEQFSARATE